jgi:hypothetical protein
MKSLMSVLHNSLQHLCSIRGISENVSLSWTWYIYPTLPAHLKHMEAIHHCSHWYTCSTTDNINLRIVTGWHTSLQKTELPLSDLLWTCSPYGVQSLTCNFFYTRCSPSQLFFYTLTFLLILSEYGISHMGVMFMLCAWSVYMWMSLTFLQQVLHCTKHKCVIARTLHLKVIQI